MQRDDKVYVRHALEAAEKSALFIHGHRREDLNEDEKLALSLVRLLEVIGEAANLVSQPFRDKYPEVPWKSMVALRNRLIHGYFDINYDIVWKTINQDLPALAEKLNAVLRKEESA